ncbi:MAG: cytochrome c [Winogradskyella sp.]|uniref:c-type cytochrome n=1 Tax=Winogradskyella sp. TaxID=1883156 RepID=UPI000F3C46F5|nr:cytochrome c [Winogradskyella sp.]RNC88445.1 MAG: cytochrome c [Winogradskyella sp.]
MKTTLKITVVLVMLLSIVSCNKKSRRNYQYMPNMYQSVGYEAYQESDAFKNGKEGQLPVEGTIPRGYTLYEIEDTNDGYEYAKANLESPLDTTTVDYDRGKELYDIYCTICHGNKGAGNGYLGEGNRELILPGSYAVKELTAGSIYHVIYYGKNSMGSYANFMSEEERWQVVAYVEKLKAELEK